MNGIVSVHKVMCALCVYVIVVCVGLCVWGVCGIVCDYVCDCVCGVECGVCVHRPSVCVSIVHQCVCVVACISVCVVCVCVIAWYCLRVCVHVCECV
jgi:hypothetical protein